MSKVAIAAVASLMLVSSTPALAGEVTGSGKDIDINGRSECAFSGQEDGVTLIGFNPDGSPILVFDTPTGPGLVQTPHHENGAGVVHEPGVAGIFCRGN